MQMSLSMHWHGTSVPSISGMEESELSWLHPLPLCTSVVVQQKKIDVMRKAEISPGKHSWKEARKETVEEFSKQSTELKKNTNNIDLHEDKLSREKKTCV